MKDKSLWHKKYSKVRRYEPANLEEVANLQVLMSPKQKGKFYSMLKRVKKLFLGTKGRWKGVNRIKAWHKTSTK